MRKRFPTQIPNNTLKRKSSYPTLNSKYWKPKYHKLQHYKTNVNARNQNKLKVKEENHNWKKDSINFP